ncbi:hypothetical protein Dimus_011191 [Dionaea muscipula]
MCQLKREDGIWWLGTSANRRTDDIAKEVNAEVENDEAPAENVENVNQGENLEENVEWETQSEEEVATEDVNFVEPEVQVQGEVKEKEPEIDVYQKGKTKTAGVDPSGNLPDHVLLYMQAEMDQVLKPNSRFQELYQQLKSKPPTSPKP